MNNLNQKQMIEYFVQLNLSLGLDLIKTQHSLEIFQKLEPIQIFTKHNFFQGLLRLKESQMHHYRQIKNKVIKQHSDLIQIISSLNSHQISKYLKNLLNSINLLVLAKTLNHFLKAFELKHAIILFHQFIFCIISQLKLILFIFNLQQHLKDLRLFNERTQKNYYLNFYYLNEILVIFALFLKNLNSLHQQHILVIFALLKNLNSLPQIHIHHHHYLDNQLQIIIIFIFIINHNRFYGANEIKFQIHFIAIIAVILSFNYNMELKISKSYLIYQMKEEEYLKKQHYNQVYQEDYQKYQHYSQLEQEEEEEEYQKYQHYSQLEQEEEEEYYSQMEEDKKSQVQEERQNSLQDHNNFIIGIPFNYNQVFIMGELIITKWQSQLDQNSIKSQVIINSCQIKILQEEEVYYFLNYKSIMYFHIFYCGQDFDTLFFIRHLTFRLHISKQFFQLEAKSQLPAKLTSYLSFHRFFHSNGIIYLSQKQSIEVVDCKQSCLTFPILFPSTPFVFYASHSILSISFFIILSNFVTQQEV
ncbi:transmembrane protein, putative (macronuclear) [Tetrahymena thermophila SB210]|uniref:Transmembrane protein, putative n=1 Tax=Tetrahymena thermophila (strain SB210) TaxID=312017 RepID=W7XJI9_TETTS|nr:transmembrane protein, putative [Tetrahymena thermophila SB210]EWS74199.1 transmembrane protein, putative [Tetrahymena thermophila SB210]|eukprot:XP_012653259.1 transmembrane protein, putative [Tetrahymena thermophila SB210]